MKARTILIVDPDQSSVAAMRRYLTADGPKRIYAEDSTQNAADILRAAKPQIDCVICAEDVAPFTGIEFLKGVRTGKYSDAPYVRGVTFVMVTAHRERDLVEACKALDVDSYIVKPFDLNSFTRHMHGALARVRDLAPEKQYMDVDIGKAIRLPVLLRHGP